MTIAHTSGANSRIDGEHEQAAEAVQRAEQVEEVRRLDPRRPVGEGERRDDHREPAEPQREQELRDELVAVRVGGRTADTSVLPVRTNIEPTSSSSALMGVNTLLASALLTAPISRAAIPRQRGKNPFGSSHARSTCYAAAAYCAYPRRAPIAGEG